MRRREFLGTMLAAAGTAALDTVPGRTPDTAGTRTSSALRPDPGRILDLPDGFGYRVVSRAGDRMADGLRVPAAHDGMATFPAADGRIVLVCNHELELPDAAASAFADGPPPAAVLDACYDAGRGQSPGPGGTTTTVWNPATGRTERQWLSLAGTDTNCAGGTTPWGSWLSCEECFLNPGSSVVRGRELYREQRHGYVFEVPAGATELTPARPLPALGRFEHEAAAVHAATGIVYLTEDRHHALFYRFLPDVRGDLAAGGRLQALALRDAPSGRTHNWGLQADVPLRETLDVAWIDLDNVDPDENDLRLRGALDGAATFARSEGLCIEGDTLYFACTNGGHAGLGQIFGYTLSAAEGTPAERASPGTLQLLVEAERDSLLHHADNLAVAPWGDLVVCEDTGSHCGLVGVRPDGGQYAIADNPYSNSELAGVCFSPDGATLFVNIQYPGLTLAIDGPFGRFAA